MIRLTKGTPYQRKRFYLWARWVDFIDGRYRGYCHYCKVEIFFHPKDWAGQPQPDNQATIDHVVPLSKGGKNHADNMVWACRKCNNQKGSEAKFTPPEKE